MCTKVCITRLSLTAAILSLSLCCLGCNIGIPDGVFACSSDMDCPETWSCLDYNNRRACFRSPPPATADGCAQDNGGCGDPERWTCTQDSQAEIHCIDVDECLQNNGDCGDASRWTCINRPGEAASCNAVNACAENNGDCGDPTRWHCSTAPGPAVSCSVIDPCSIEHGGCGDPELSRCAIDENDAVTCTDVDECEVDNGQCGDPMRSRCVNHSKAPATCEDVDECAQDNGGCGDPGLWHCENNANAAPGCQRLDACADDEACGDATHWRCVAQADSDVPECQDIDECAVDNGGCGDPTRARCVNHRGAAATCVDIDECAEANGGCGDKARWRCVNRPAAPPTCVDIDECAQANGGCGDPSSRQCTNNQGAPPSCTCLWSAPFAQVSPVPGLNAAEPGVLEVTVRLDADELNAIFVSNRPHNAGLPRNQNLWMASRASRDQAFSTPVLLPGGNQTNGYSYSFWISDDWRSVYIQADPKGFSELFFATRPSATDPFGAPTVLSALGPVESPWLQPDGTLYFETSQRIYRARKEGTSFAQPELWEDLGSESAAALILSRDDLTAYFGSGRDGGMGGADVWVAHREDTSRGFAAAIHVDGVSSTQQDYPSWISPDACRLYFFRYEAGRSDLFVAER
jgi:hypothetical protein